MRESGQALAKIITIVVFALMAFVLVAVYGEIEGYVETAESFTDKTLNPSFDATVMLFGFLGTRRESGFTLTRDSHVIGC